eukprot:8849555-Pyramimonas_sp.AAC.1
MAALASAFVTPARPVPRRQAGRTPGEMPVVRKRQSFLHTRRDASRVAESSVFFGLLASLLVTAQERVER